MAIYVANNGQLQTIKGIYYGMTEDYINATRFHNLVPKTATEIRFLYASDNPDLTGYQRIGYCDNNNFIEVWNNDTKHIIINPRKNYIYAPSNCVDFLSKYTSLTNCVLENFDTRNVINMAQMFQDCSSLTSLDLSSFNTNKVTNMWRMMYNCNRLTSLNLSSFNTQNVMSLENMFIYCSALRTIIANTFNISHLQSSTQMFYNCFNIKGGNGTAFSVSHVNAEYARVDGENGLPGYFTAPTN